MLKLNIHSTIHGECWLNFEDQSALDAYVAQVTESQHWGLNQRWAFAQNQAEIDSALSSRQVEISPAIEEISHEEVDPETGEITTVIDQEAQDAIFMTEYLLPAQWSVDQEDITEQVEVQRKVEEALRAQDVGAKCIARVWAINESKNLSAQDFNTLMNDQNLARIERLLWTGSLKTAKLLITGLDQTYFSANEKAEILAIINDSGLV